jgi:4a-hydroxytetrahydrobiopterin dehydratase
MTTQTSEQLTSKRCAACEGDVEKLSAAQARDQMQALSGWELTDDGRRIRKNWEVKSFVAGMEFLNQVAELAEQEGHHPDLHLEGYRHVWIGVWTHAIGGLSESDFILAAKIDQLPVQLKASRKGGGEKEPCSPAQGT